MFYIVLIVIIFLILYIIIYEYKFIHNNINSKFKYHNKDTLLILSNIKEKIKKLIIYCKHNEKNKEYINYINRINQKIDNMNMYENIDYNSNTTSFTVNKG